MSLYDINKFFAFYPFLLLFFYTKQEEIELPEIA